MIFSENKNDWTCRWYNSRLQKSYKFQFLLNFKHQWPDRNSWPWVPCVIFLSGIRVTILFKQSAPCFYCLHQIICIIYYAESAKSHNQNKWGPSSLGQLYNITTTCRDKFIGAIRGEISTVRQQASHLKKKKQNKTDFVHQGPFRSPWITLCISHYTHFEVWDENVYSFPIFNGAGFEVWSNFIPNFTGHVIIYPS